MIPNLFVVGAPKCGTTTVAHWLGQHPDVFVSKVKEPHFFYSPYGNELSRSEYDNLYQHARGKFKVIVDASVWYLFSKVAVPKICAESESAKFIVCLRNPLDMAPSLHAQKRYTGHELIESFSEAWGLAQEREEGNYSGIWGIQSGDASHMSYRKACKLGEQVQELLKVVKLEQVKLIFLDDIVDDPRRVWFEICDFLHIPRHQPISLEKRNPATSRKSFKLHMVLMYIGKLKKALGLNIKTGLVAPVHKINTAQEKYKTPSEKMYKDMIEEFSPDIKLLARISGRNLDSWTAQRNIDVVK